MGCFVFVCKALVQEPNRHCPLYICYPTGVISVLANVRPFDDLAHPLCRNLRDGNWMLDYVVERLRAFVGTRQVSFLDHAVRQ